MYSTVFVLLLYLYHVLYILLWVLLYLYWNYALLRTLMFTCSGECWLGRWLSWAGTLVGDCEGVRWIVPESAGTYHTIVYICVDFG